MARAVLWPGGRAERSGSVRAEGLAIFCHVLFLRQRGISGGLLRRRPIQAKVCGREKSLHVTGIAGEGVGFRMPGTRKKRCEMFPETQEERNPEWWSSHRCVGSARKERMRFRRTVGGCSPTWVRREMLRRDVFVRPHRHPCTDLRAEGINASVFAAGSVVNRHAEIFGPAHGGAFVAREKGGDVFPGIEAIGGAWLHGG